MSNHQSPMPEAKALEEISQEEWMEADLAYLYSLQSRIARVLQKGDGVKTNQDHLAADDRTARAESTSLHARIMNLPARIRNASYTAGHRDARHAAAELAAEHENAMHLARSRIEELEQALNEILGVDVMSPEGGHEEVAEIHCIARSVLNKEQKA